MALTVLRLVQGRLSELEQARRAMASEIGRIPPTFFVVRAYAARERDDRDGAREAFELGLARGLLEQPRGPTWAMSLTWAADICAWLDDRPTAMRLHGLLALTLGRPEEAERRLRDAIALCERMDARAFLSMARADLGNLLHPAAAGRRLLRQAHADAHELGMLGL